MYFVLSAVFAATSAFVLPSIDASLQCDTQWFYYDYTKSCYYVGDYQDFDGAERACVNLGGHLTSIQTNYESSFIQALTETGEKQHQEGMTWIGLHYVNNSWTWTDGTPFTFSYWMKGAPEKPTKYGCGLILQDDYTSAKGQKGFWDSAECKVKMRKYVCKKPSNF